MSQPADARRLQEAAEVIDWLAGLGERWLAHQERLVEEAYEENARRESEQSARETGPGASGERNN